MTLRMYDWDGELVIEGAAVGGGTIGSGVFIVTLSWSTGGWVVSTQRTRDSNDPRVILNNSQLHEFRFAQYVSGEYKYNRITSQQWPWEGIINVDTRYFHASDNSWLAPWKESYGFQNGLYVEYRYSPHRVPPGPGEYPFMTIHVYADADAILANVEPPTATHVGTDRTARLAWNTYDGARNTINLLQLGTSGAGVIEYPRYVEFLRGSKTKEEGDLDAYFTIDNLPGYWIVMTPAGGRSEYPKITVVSNSQYTRNPMSWEYHTATDLFRIEKNLPMSYFIQVFAPKAPTVLTE